MSASRGIMLLAVVLASGWASAQTVPPRAEELSRAVEPAIGAPYDPIGRRDPFRPPRAGSQTPLGEPRTPLQRYEIGQLRLVAIIYETRDPRAVVEDDQGLGYIVRVGTPIGPNGGEVRTIERGRVIVEESSVDFYGERQPNQVTLELRTADRGKR